MALQPWQSVPRINPLMKNCPNAKPGLSPVSRVPRSAPASLSSASVQYRLCERLKTNVNSVTENNLSLSSAALEASSNFSLAACSLFSVLSNSSSRLRTRFVSVCTSPSAYKSTHRLIIAWKYTSLYTHKTTNIYIAVEQLGRIFTPRALRS